MSDCICVLGMHRSGTSCLTGIMQRMGVELGEVFEQNPFNARGNREHPRIMALNEALLAHNDGSWDRPALVTRWTTEQAAERDAIVSALSGDGGPWGFKDPRTLFTLPFWQQAVSPRFIGTFRHPLKVAGSLQHRNDFALEQSFEIWEAYNRRLLKLAEQDAAMPLVNFDLVPERYLDEVMAKLAALGLDPKRSEHARQFFEASLKRQEQFDFGDIHLPGSTVALYEQLLDAADRA